MLIKKQSAAEADPAKAHGKKLRSGGPDNEL
jgi:hypothetical protein